MLEFAHFLFANIFLLVILLVEIACLVAIIYVFVFVFVNVLMLVFYILRLKKLFRATESVKLNLIVGIMIVLCYSNKEIKDYKDNFRTNLDD
jgi:hypothetical protein